MNSVVYYVVTILLWASAIGVGFFELPIDYVRFY